MNSIQKINSVQGGVLTASQNLVDFNIPAGMKVDMSKSYINLNCEISPGDPAGRVHVLQMLKNNLGNGFNHALAPSVSMVKHASLRFDNVGMVEDMRDVNILRTNARVYENDCADMRSEDFKGINGKKDEHNLFGSPFIDFVKEGTTASKYKPHDIRVPLSELFGLGDQIVDTGKYGAGSMHLELELSDVGVYERQGATAGTGSGYWALTDLRSQTNAGALSSNGSCGARNNATSGDITVAQATDPGGLNGGAQFPMTRLYDSLEESPFYVGQEVSITGTNMTDADFHITGISYDSANKLITLTLNTVITLTNGAQPATEVSLTGKDSVGNNSFVFNSAQLVVYEDTSGQPSPDQIQYKTYSTEVDTTAAQTSYRRLFFLEPECQNVLIMTPRAGSNVLSDLDVSSYRMRVNGEETTNRPVVAGSPLHYDRIARVLLNQDKTLKNITEMTMDIDGNGYNNGSHLTRMIAEAVPITASQKQFELEINSGAGATKVYLYKEVLRNL